MKILKCFIGCGSSITFAEIFPIINSIYSWNIPPVIMQSAQLLAWLVAIVIGAITIINYIRKIKIKELKF